MEKQNLLWRKHKKQQNDGHPWFQQFAAFFQQFPKFTICFLSPSSVQFLCMILGHFPICTLELSPFPHPFYFQVFLFSRVFSASSSIILPAFPHPPPQRSEGDGHHRHQGDPKPRPYGRAKPPVLRTPALAPTRSGRLCVTCGRSSPATRGRWRTCRRM